MWRALLQLTPVIVVAALVGIADTESGGRDEKRARKRDGLTGSVRIDGAPAMRDIVDRSSQRFEQRHPGVRVTVGASGDESAIGLFCAGEVDIAAVARRLDRAERRECRRSGSPYSEIEVARAPIALVVGERNHLVDRLSLDQAKAVWRRAAPATTWADLDSTLPSTPLEPVGWRPDTPAATLLAEALFGPVDPLMRDDYRVVDDVRGLSGVVAESTSAIGFLPLVQLKPGSGLRAIRVVPRPLYLEVSANSLRQPEVRRYLREYLRHPPAVRASDGARAVPFSHGIHRKFTQP
jgi:phosphate transport system substrate-binding protein